MLSFSCTDIDVKKFMSILFKDTKLDSYEIRNVSILHFAKFDIDGMLDKDIISQFSEDNKRFFCIWEELKPFVYNFIKGKIKPKGIKIVFSKDLTFVKNFHPNAAALFLNLNYENDILNFTTATSQKNFSLDKTLDTLWDEYIIQMFKELGIAISNNY